MRILKRILSILVLVILGCSISEAKSTEVRTFNGIDGVVALGSGDVSITIGDKEEITIHAPADLIPYLKTELKDGTLYVGERLKGWNKLKHLKKDIRYDIVVKSINHVGISGSGDIDLERLTGDKCTAKIFGSGDIDVKHIDSDNTYVKILGSGDINITNISTNDLDVTINGSGDTDISGKTDDLLVTINGSGDCIAKDLKSYNATVDIHGSGDAIIDVDGTLSVNIYGSGDVVYHGNPTVNTKTKGSGDITHR